MAPSDRQTGFTDIGGNFLCDGCVALNNTDITNTAFGRDGLGNKILQIMWIGVRYAVTDKLDVIAAYYHYTQNSYYGTRTAGPLPCSGSEHSQCAGTFNAISGVIDWQFAGRGHAAEWRQQAHHGCREIRVQSNGRRAEASPPISVEPSGMPTGPTGERHRCRRGRRAALSH
jgi:hypothetical protein